MTRPRKPVNPLNQARDQRLRGLLARAEQHRTLESRILSLLPEKLAGQCRLGGIQNGEMTLIVPNATVASQLRFQQRALLPALRREPQLEKLWRLRVRVSPRVPRPETPVPERHLSHENARLLEQEAGHTRDESLRKVLLKLASHQR